MEIKEMERPNLEVNKYKNHVHQILARSYIVYFLIFLFSIFLDLTFNFKTFNFPFMMPVGLILIFLASFFILWAQKTSRNLIKENITKETFFKGPYRFTRTPTHLGLFVLMLGFGILNNAIFIIIFSIISFVFNKIVFLKKQEMILEKKYGVPYLEYKKLVRF